MTANSPHPDGPEASAKERVGYKRSSETKARILEAARRLIVGGGLDALSMRKLASEAGVSVTTLYDLNGSRDEMRRQLERLQRGLDKGAQELLRRLAEQQNKMSAEEMRKAAEMLRRMVVFPAPLPPRNETLCRSLINMDIPLMAITLP